VLLTKRLKRPSSADCWHRSASLPIWKAAQLKGTS
jgi:hypothetical protein